MRYILVMALIVTAVCGCTKQAWYEGAKTGHANDCNRLDGEAREKCLKNIDMSYDEYEKLRK